MRAPRKEQDPDGRLVLLADVRQASARIAAAVEREGGEWRIITPPDVPALPYEGQALMVKAVVAWGPRARDFARAATRPRQESAARAVAEQYLSAWAHGQEPRMLELTSPLALDYAPSLPAFSHRRAHRLDRGVSPLADAAAVALQPVAGLTAWEQEFLAVYVLILPHVTGLMDLPFNLEARPRDFPTGYARRGELAAFQYAVAGQQFLMLLVRHDAGWRILEPALRL